MNIPNIIKEKKSINLINRVLLILKFFLNISTLFFYQSNNKIYINTFTNT